MAFLMDALTEEEVKKTGVAEIRKQYVKLADYYNKLKNCDYIYCAKCGTFKSKNTFYLHKEYASGYFPICKSCLLMMVEQRKGDRDKPRETKESVQTVLHMMNKPYNDALYENCVKSSTDEVSERTKPSPFQMYMVQMASLPQWKDKTWKNSDFGYRTVEVDGEEIDEEEINKELIKAGRKRFGSYPQEDLLFLEKEYEDWVSRYPCDTKSQEVLFQGICCKQLEIDKAQKGDRDTSKLYKDLQDMMGSLGVKPNQSDTDGLTDTLTFGQLIAKWEEEKPIPEPEEEFKDIDKIGLYIDVFFKGHLAKMMELKNAYSSIYEKFMNKYTVKKPQYDGEDSTSESLFEKIFGNAEI